MEETIVIDTAYITLTQLLKKTAIVTSGGQVKSFIAQVPIFINNRAEDRRGKKLYPGDSIEVKGYGTFHIRTQA